MSHLAFEQTEAFRTVARRRTVFLMLALGLDLVALLVLACLRIGQPDDPGDAFLGYELHFEPFTLRAALWLAALVLAQFLLAHWAMVQALKSEDSIELVPEDKTEGHRFGELTGAEIVALTYELAESLGVRRPDRIILQKQPIPNAFTGAILGYGTILVLHTNLLEIMSRTQVRAIIAHELGHVRRWDSFFNQIANLPRSFQFFVKMVLLFKVLVGLWFAGSVGMFFTRLAFLWLGWSLLSMVFGWLEKIGNLAMQQSELLCDGYAARVCGADQVINALLRLGERSEALMTLAQAIVPYQARLERPLTDADILRLLSRFPPGEMSARVARETAAEIFVRDQLLFLREKLLVPLPDSEIDRLAQVAAEAIKAEDAEKPAEERQPEPDPTEEDRLIDWRHFDIDHSGNLNHEELSRLVAELRRQPTRMIFRQFLQPDSEWESHPTIRHRLIFLYETFIEPTRTHLSA